MLFHLVGLHATYGPWTRKARKQFHINQVKFTIPRKTRHRNSNAWILSLNQIVLYRWRSYGLYTNNIWCPHKLTHAASLKSPRVVSVKWPTFETLFCEAIYRYLKFLKLHKNNDHAKSIATYFQEHSTRLDFCFELPNLAQMSLSFYVKFKHKSPKMIKVCSLVKKL